MSSKKTPPEDPEAKPKKKGRPRVHPDDLTATEQNRLRQAEYRKRRAETGRKQLSVWVSPEAYQALEKYMETGSLTASEVIESLLTKKQE